MTAHAAEPSAYTRTAVALHWGIALLLLAQLALGWWMLGLPKAPPGLRAGWFHVHKSLGLLVGALVLVRLAWRLAHAPRPAALPAWQRRAAGATHALLYLALLTLPLSGYLGSAWSGYPVKAFGLLLPTWTAAWPQGKAAMSTLHLAAAWTLVALLALHVAAAAWHAWRRDGIAGRMGWHLQGHPR